MTKEELKEFGRKYFRPLLSIATFIFMIMLLPTFAGTEPEPDVVDDPVVIPVVEDVNQAPNAVDDAVTTPQDVSVIITVLANDSDPDGDDISITSVTQGTLGSVAIIGDTISYVPTEGALGTDTFTYTITDGEEFATANVTVAIIATPLPPDPEPDPDPVNTAPIANPDIGFMDAGTTKQFGLIGNDFDPDGDPIALDTVTLPVGATLVGTLVEYTAPAGVGAIITVPYTITDGTLIASSVLTITVVADPVPPPPDPILVEVTVIDSEDLPIVGVTPIIDFGSVATMPATDESGVSTYLVPGTSTTTSVTVVLPNGSTETQVQDVSVDPTFLFQTVEGKGTLSDSSGDPLEGGVLEIFTTDWYILGITTTYTIDDEVEEAAVFFEVFAGTYDFRMNYGGSNEVKANTDPLAPLVEFETELTRIYLYDSHRNPLAGGVAYIEYATDLWFELGETTEPNGTDGSIEKELLKGTFNFRMNFRDGSKEQLETIEDIPVNIIEFMTEEVRISLQTAERPQVNIEVIDENVFLADGEVYFGTYKDENYIGTTGGARVENDWEPTSYIDGMSLENGFRDDRYVYYELFPGFYDFTIYYHNEIEKQLNVEVVEMPDDLELAYLDLDPLDNDIIFDAEYVVINLQKYDTFEGIAGGLPVIVFNVPSKDGLETISPTPMDMNILTNEGGYFIYTLLQEREYTVGMKYRGGAERDLMLVGQNETNMHTFFAAKVLIHLQTLEGVPVEGGDVYLGEDYIGTTYGPEEQNSGRGENTPAGLVFTYLIDGRYVFRMEYLDDEDTRELLIQEDKTYEVIFNAFHSTIWLVDHTYPVEGRAPFPGLTGGEVYRDLGEGYVKIGETVDGVFNYGYLTPGEKTIKMVYNRTFEVRSYYAGREEPVIFQTGGVAIRLFESDGVTQLRPEETGYIFFNEDSNQREKVMFSVHEFLGEPSFGAYVMYMGGEEAQGVDVVTGELTYVDFLTTEVNAATLNAEDEVIPGIRYVLTGLNAPNEYLDNGAVRFELLNGTYEMNAVLNGVVSSQEFTVDDQSSIRVIFRTERLMVYLFDHEVTRENMSVITDEKGLVTLKVRGNYDRSTTQRFNDEGYAVFDLFKGSYEFLATYNNTTDEKPYTITDDSANILGFITGELVVELINSEEMRMKPDRFAVSNGIVLEWNEREKVYKGELFEFTPDVSVAYNGTNQTKSDTVIENDSVLITFETTNTFTIKMYDSGFVLAGDPTERTPADITDSGAFTMKFKPTGTMVDPTKEVLPGMFEVTASINMSSQTKDFMIDYTPNMLVFRTVFVYITAPNLTMWDGNINGNVVDHTAPGLEQLPNPIPVAANQATITVLITSAPKDYNVPDYAAESDRSFEISFDDMIRLVEFNTYRYNNNEKVVYENQAQIYAVVNNQPVLIVQKTAGQGKASAYLIDGMYTFKATTDDYLDVILEGVMISETGPTDTHKPTNTYVPTVSILFEDEVEE
jgi:hypothetical protein